MKNKPSLYIIILIPILFIGIGIILFSVNISGNFLKEAYIKDYSAYIKNDSERFFDIVKSRYRQLVLQSGQNPEIFYEVQDALKIEIKRDFKKYIKGRNYSGLIYEREIKEKRTMPDKSVLSVFPKNLSLNTIHGVENIMGNFLVYKFEFKPFKWEIVIAKNTLDIDDVLLKNKYLNGLIFASLMFFILVVLWIILRVSFKKEIDNIIDFFKLHRKGKLLEFEPKSIEMENIKIGINDSYKEIVKYENSLISLNRSLERKVEDRTKELKEQSQKAQISNKAKSEFLANMSHEIRTPLNAIMGFIELLQEKENDKEKQKYLDIVGSSSKSLLEIINDILDFSKIESGNLSIEYIDFQPYNEFKITKKLFKAKFEEKNLRLHTSYNELPKSLNGDVLRIKQVINNLLSNAAKFTEEHKNIYLEIEYEDGKLDVSVRDEGVGIGKEYQDKIFDAFSQEDSSTTRKYGGTGLGLSISYNLVKMMGGELKVKSELGVGSEFYFLIPLKIGKDIKKEKEINKDIKLDGKILLVEDNIANQMFMKVILKKLNLTFDIANDGIEAVEKFELCNPAGTRTNKYDVILMDENMPNLNGIEATKIILDIEKKQNLKHTPIIALTANALKGDRERFLSAGMDEYLTKPLDKNKLIILINKFMEKV